MESPAVCVLQEPHFKCAPAWIEVYQCTKDIQKDTLDDFLGFARILYDS